MFICAGESEQFDFAIPVGIGMTDVAINLQSCASLKNLNFYFLWGQQVLMAKKRFLIL